MGRKDRSLISGAISVPVAKRQSRLGIRLLLPLLWIALPLYFVTSLVVVINSFVWMPSFPSLWYQIDGVMYLPFRPYLNLMYSLLGQTDISYQAYAMITRLPFLGIPLAVAMLGIIKAVRGRSGGTHNKIE